MHDPRVTQQAVQLALTSEDGDELRVHCQADPHPHLHLTPNPNEAEELRVHCQADPHLASDGLALTLTLTSTLTQVRRYLTSPSTRWGAPIGFSSS